MGLPTPESKHPFTLAVWSIDIVNEKLLHWKHLVEEGATPLWGYQKEWRYKATQSTGSSILTPNLFDLMNPLQYWKALTERKAKEITWRDEVNDNNPQYWEAKYRLACDALAALTQFGPDWAIAARNLCFPHNHIEREPSSSSNAQLLSSNTLIVPDIDNASHFPAQNSQQQQRPSTTKITAPKGTRRNHPYPIGIIKRRSARLAAKFASEQIRPSRDLEPVRTPSRTKRKRYASQSAHGERDVKRQLYPK
jgi:hypothetical protein